MTVSCQPLDPLTLPLTGVRLIEASAGTGKTYTISTLYLRLLLGQRGDCEPLTVEQILVVTFTRAATQELRDRVRQRISDAQFAFAVGHSKDNVLQALLDRSDDPGEDLERLNSAMRQMDEAAIYTIHGFCQRVLKQNAFESGVLFDNEFITDEEDIKQQAASDFWRRHFYDVEDSLAAVISSYWESPKKLLFDVSPWLAKQNLRFMPECSDFNIVEQHKKNLAKIEYFKQQWRDANVDFLDFIQQSDIKKNPYNKKNLPNWLDQISLFSVSITRDYLRPKCLEKFGQTTLIEKTPKGEAPRHPVFELIDELLCETFSLKEIVVQHATKEIGQLLTDQKRKVATLAPDDLLSNLASALTLSHGELLADTIRQQYPVAMIDEFQDTDSLQYQIYQDVYMNKDNACLLMIGDPKQAIYAFRGADVFAYIGAKRRIGNNNTYTLSTNYRSTTPMVAGVNALFDFSDMPFVYDDDIPFSAVKSVENDEALLVRGENRDGLQFLYLLAEDQQPIGKEKYQQFFADYCAADIFQLLETAQKGDAMIGDRLVEAKDIAVLVRDRHEAIKIRSALLRHNIPSVFISDDSVLQTSEAGDLYRVLKACLEYRNERAVRSALATSLFCWSAMDLDRLNHDEMLWENLLAEFYDYHLCWLRHGVMAMLRKLMKQRGLAPMLLSKSDGDRILTNVLHITELLQVASTELHGAQDLMRWFSENRSVNGRAGSDEQQIRLESDENLVQIVTIHKSKGLEYNVVYLPFAVGYREVSSAHFHDQESGELVVDLSRQPESIKRADRERLAEDLRLLYVALTRSIHRCVVGVCNLKYAQNKKGSAVKHTAMGHLLLPENHEDCDDVLLLSRLSMMNESESALSIDKLSCDFSLPEGLLKQTPSAIDELAALTFFRNIETDWTVTSYSALSRNYSSVDSGRNANEWLLDHVGYDEGVDSDQLTGEASSTEKDEQTIFTFPRGAHAGTFMHTVFEQISFPEARGELLKDVVEKNLGQYGFDEKWLSVIEMMVANVLDACLNKQANLHLREVMDSKRLVEMEFYLPLAKLKAPLINGLLQQYGYLSEHSLSFYDLQGMLKGFIDLVIEHDGLFYVLDYKSNHLGNSSEYYHPDKLKEAISHHRYDLQYLLYTLALHRYLKQRVKGYSYDKNFGGAYYLFLRGFSEKKSAHGIFHDKPERSLIDALDTLISGGE